MGVTFETFESIKDIQPEIHKVATTANKYSNHTQGGNKGTENRNIALEVKQRVLRQPITGNALQAYRIAKGISLREVAEIIGISFRTVSKYEKQEGHLLSSLREKMRIFYGSLIDEELFIAKR